jgi:hypothetical protein
MSSTEPAYLILFNFAFLSILCEDYNLWKSELCDFLQAPII